MTVSSHQRPAPLPARGRDPYRFGPGPRPALQPGTFGWAANDLLDPEVRGLWDAGRYEIIDGVLTLMPAAYFRGGSAAITLAFILRDHLRARGTPAAFAGEVDIELAPDRVVRADAVVVIGGDLPLFEAMTFDPPGGDWRDHPLRRPPSLVIESVSAGHEAHDRRTKRAWYARFGVPRYWIVDAYARSLECLRLEAGEYVTDAAGAGDFTLRPAAFPGLQIPLGEVWSG